MTVKQRRLKLIEFTINGVSFECQIKSWNLDAGVEDGERQYTFCPDGEFVEDTDPDPSLELSFFADWRLGGINDYLWQNSGAVANFVLDHHPDIVGEHVRWTGTLKIKPPPAGGEARTTEMSEVTLQIVTLNPMERP